MPRCLIWMDMGVRGQLEAPGEQETGQWSIRASIMACPVAKLGGSILDSLRAEHKGLAHWRGTGRKAEDDGHWLCQ